MLNAQGTQLQVLEVNDFSGGLTDDFVAGDRNQFQVGDNLDIGDDNALYTRPGSVLRSKVYPRLPTASRIGGITDLEGELIVHSDRRVYSMNETGFHLAQTPNGVNPLSSGTSNSLLSSTKWNKHLIAVSSDGGQPTRVFKDNTGTLKAQALGLPAYPGTISVTNYVPGSGSSTYIWATHYKYVYQVGDVTFEENGPVVYHDNKVNDYVAQNGVAIKNLSFSGGFPINGLPYDVANITLEIYRNTDKGSTFYHVGSIAAPTSGVPALFTDAISDTLLQTNSVIYTDGGILDHERPPECKYVHQTNDIIAFACIKEDGVYKNNKLRFANQAMPYSSPGSHAVVFDDDIVGVSSVGSYFIVFCRGAIYRLEGIYNMKGQGSVIKKKISDTVGLVGFASLIQIESGIYFAGTDGFYFCNGSSVTRISNDINATYASLIDAGYGHRIVGTMDRIRKKVLWGVTKDGGIAENRTIFVGHLTKARNNTVPFTTWSGGRRAHNFSATALHFFENQVVRGDKDGYIFVHDSDYASDPSIDTSRPVSSWGAEAIIYNYISVCYDFGSAAIRKWAPYLILNVGNETSVSMDIFSANDNSQDFKSMKSILKKGNVSFGDPSVLFGDNIFLGSYPIISKKLRFPTPVRCSYKQIKLTNSYVSIEKSKASTIANFNPTTCELTLISPDEIWPYDCNGYDIKLESIDQQFRIEERTDTKLKLETSAGVAAAGAQNWEISGYRSNEILQLLSYSIYFSHTSPSQEPYRAGE